MNRQEKSDEVQNLAAGIQKAKALFFLENKGLSVAEMTDLRKKLRKEKATLKVVKNRLMKLALKQINAEQLSTYFSGPTTVTYSESDPVIPAKILTDFIKDRENFVIKGGFLEGQMLDPNRIKALAQLPSREELYSMLLRVLLGPATQMANVLAAIPRQLVTVVDAIGKKKES